MKRSKNYNMYLPEKTEFYNVEDMNKNTEIIDEELKKIDDEKVDKVSGKDLSTNDYTNEEKNKLEGIAEGAEVNVQPNWNVTDAANDAYIKNKPAIPSKLSELLNDSGYKTTDNNTTYSAGAQLALSGTVFRLADYCTKITDWNSALTNGWYYGDANALNSPPSGSWHYGIVIAQGTSWKMQIVYSFGDYSGTSFTVKQYQRIMLNGEWKDWADRVYHSEIANFLKDSNGAYELFLGAELYNGARLRTIGPNGRLDFLFSNKVDGAEFFGVKNLTVGATVDLGSANYKWKNIYAATSTITTSDKSEKRDIKDLDETKTIDFIMGLQPKSFKFIDGSSGRTHHGMLSDDVEELLENLGMSTLDFAGFIKSPKTRMVEKDGEFVEEAIEGEYTRGLRYEEFEADIIKMLQILWEKNGALEKENAELKAKISNIESVLEKIKNKLDM
ncbi:MAG: tail fiber domain-containing protein [Lachnospiraceae bacterium]|nr:tail fiber domain-containing protein [Lachnospiraceae bacterium]